MPPTDDDYAREVIRTVADLSRTVAEYQQHADEERAVLNATVERKWQDMIATVEAMRKDVFRAIISLQLNASQHRDEHSAERKERAADAIDRLNRQMTWNLWMGALTALVVINLLLIGFVVVKVAQVVYGR